MLWWDVGIFSLFEKLRRLFPLFFRYDSKVSKYLLDVMKIMFVEMGSIYRIISENKHLNSVC